MSDVMSELELVGALAAETRFVVQEFFPGAHTSILSTGVCCDVLKHFGVPAQPVASVIVAGNAEWFEWKRAAEWLADGPPPPGAYSVGVRPFEAHVHLVAETAGGLLDADLGYWNRPDQGILLPQGAFLVDGFGAYPSPPPGGRGGVVYRPHPRDNGSWRRSEQWTWKRRGLVKRMIGVCERMLVT